MIETLSTQWYTGVDTRNLILLVKEAKEHVEHSTDTMERDIWSMRLQKMREELLRRQDLMEQVEI